MSGVRLRKHGELPVCGQASRKRRHTSIKTGACCKVLPWYPLVQAAAAAQCGTQRPSIFTKLENLGDRSGLLRTCWNVIASYMAAGALASWTASIKQQMHTAAAWLLLVCLLPRRVHPASIPKASWFHPNCSSCCAARCCVQGLVCARHPHRRERSDIISPAGANHVVFSGPQQVSWNVSPVLMGVTHVSPYCNRQSQRALCSLGWTKDCNCSTLCWAS